MKEEDVLHVVSWNVWMEDVCFDVRMRSIIATLKCMRPNVACLQEITPAMVELLRNDSDICNIYDLSADYVPDTATVFGYCSLTLVEKILKCSFTSVAVPSAMGRHLIVAHWNTIAVGNIHLESLDNHPVREQQLDVCYSVLNQYDTSLLAGDFNFCSLRNYNSDPHGKSEVLQNDSLSVYLPGYDDLWLEVHRKSCEKNFENTKSLSTPTKVVPPSIPTAAQSFGTPPSGAHIHSKSIDFMGTPTNNGSTQLRNENISVEGFSYDSKWNGMLAHKEERMRYDRIMYHCKSTSVIRNHWVARTMNLLGTEPLDANLLLSTRQSGRHVVRGLWPSDHFGLSCVLTRDRSSTNIGGKDCLQNCLNIMTEKFGQSYLGLCELRQSLSGALHSLTKSNFSQNQSSLCPPLRLLALDFDATICQIHTYGKWKGSASALSAHIRPVFVEMIRTALSIPSLHVAVVTFSGQTTLIRDAIALVLSKGEAEKIYYRGNNKEWQLPTSGVPTMEGKEPHIASVLQEIFFDAGVKLQPEEVLLIDDDGNNTSVASLCRHRAVTFPRLPLPGIHMKSVVEAKGLVVKQRLQLRRGTLLCLSQGNVNKFRGYENGAVIINAENDERELYHGALEPGIVPELNAGPMHVSQVFNAVGPDYRRTDSESKYEHDDSLAYVYQQALNLAEERGVQLLCVTPLCTGKSRADRPLKSMFAVALEAVAQHTYEGLREIHILAKDDKEMECLVEAVNESREDFTQLQSIDRATLHIRTGWVRLGPGDGEAIRLFLNDLCAVSDMELCS